MNNLRNGLWLFLSGLVLVAVVTSLWRSRTAVDSETNEVLPLMVAADCDSAQTACAARGAGFAVELSLGPHVRPMQPFAIQLRAMQGQLTSSAQVELQFRMQDMEMGQNHYRLVADEQGIWHGTAVLPVCSRGRSDWLAQLAIQDGGRHWLAMLPFTAVTQ